MGSDEYERCYKTQFVSNRELSLGTCWPENEEFQESKEYKQVFASADNYLKKSSFCSGRGDKDCFPVSHDFKALIEQNRCEGVTNTWGSLSSVFLLLTWYSLRILHSPWRKTYFKIKAFNGHFQHLVYGNFHPSLVQQLMGKLGYIYHKPQQTFLFHQQTWSTTSWRDTLTQAGMDFYLIHVRCSICSTQTGSMMPVYDLTSGTVLGEKSSPTKCDLIEKPEDQDDCVLGYHGPTIFSSSAQGRRTPRHRYLEGDRDRVEAFPNKYVTRDVMMRHHKARGSEPSGVPWQHKLQGIKLADTTSSLTDDGVDLYQGRDEGSVLEATIRYPPNDLDFKISSKDREKQKLSPRKMVSTLPRPKDNYVTALPMTSHSTYSAAKRTMPREGRVESGYYSEWLNTSPLDGRSNVAKRKEAGEYVYAYPLKRPPGDGQPNVSPPLYHEVTRDKMRDSPD